MQLAWLAVTIVGTVGYHVALKATPAGTNALLSLLITYALVAAVFAAGLAFSGGFEWRQEIRGLNWTVIGLAVAIAVVDFGFLMLYRTGFAISVAALTTQTVAAMLLLAIGLLVLKEKISPANAAGVVLCLAGLWLIRR